MNTNWLNTNEYPFKHHYFKVNDTTMHYVDEGEGEVLLFVHGTPSWSFEFRNVKVLRGFRKSMIEWGLFHLYA